MVNIVQGWWRLDQVVLLNKLPDILRKGYCGTKGIGGHTPRWVLLLYLSFVHVLHVTRF